VVAVGEAGGEHLAGHVAELDGQQDPGQGLGDDAERAQRDAELLEGGGAEGVGVYRFS